MIDKNQTKDYVYQYSQTYVTMQVLKNCLPVFIFIAAIVSITGFNANGIILIECIILDFFAVIYVVFVLLMRNRWRPTNFRRRFIVSGVFRLNFSFFFFLLGYIMLDGMEKIQHNLLAIKIMLLVLYIVISLIYLFILKIRINKNKYSQLRAPNNSNKRMQIAVGLGCITAMSLFPVLNNIINPSITSFLTGSGPFVISIVFLFGIDNFLKTYLITKFSIESDGYEKQIALDLGYQEIYRLESLSIYRRKNALFYLAGNRCYDLEMDQSTYDTYIHTPDTVFREDLLAVATVLIKNDKFEYFSCFGDLFIGLGNKVYIDKAIKFAHGRFSQKEITANRHSSYTECKAIEIAEGFVKKYSLE